MFRNLVIAGVLTLAALVAALAVTSRQPRADVVLVNGAEVHTLDPGKMSWMHDIRSAYGLWEGLLSMNPRTLAPEPAVATDYSVSPDGKVYTFHLRPEARWSNGDPVTAEDFRFAWLRVLDPATASDYYNYMLIIAGAEDYYERMRQQYDHETAPATHPAPASRPDADSVAIRAPDPHTLTVELVRPVPYFNELVAFCTFLPVHRQSMARFHKHPAGKLPFDEPDWLKPGNLVSNGPFVLTRWDFQYRLVFERNPHYWDAAHVPSRRLELLANSDVNTAFLTYENGDADVLTNLPGAAKPALLAQSQSGRRNDVHVFPVWGTYYYRFNCKQPPFDDVRVRKALAMCVDRRAIVEGITRGGERPQTSFVTPGMTLALTAAQAEQTSAAPGRGAAWKLTPDGKALEYLPADGLPFDPAAAKELLAEAGYGPGGATKPFVNGQGEPVTLMMNNSPEHRPIAESIRKTWQDHLGISVNLEILDSKITGSRLKEHTFDIARAGWYTDYGDPTGYLDMFRKADGNNDGQFDVPAYDALLVESDTTANPAARYDLIHRAERILVAEQAGVIPIYQYVGQFMFRPDVEGIYPNPKQQIMLKYVGKAGARD